MSKGVRPPRLHHPLITCIIYWNKRINSNGTDIEEGADTEYEKFFMKCLKKFGVDEPDQLPDDKKKEFYDYVDKGWKADNETD